MAPLIALLSVAAFVAIYVVWLRPWLRTKSWAEGFFHRIEKFEILFYKKSESILWARFLQAVGLLVPLLQFIGAIDITPYMAIIPEGWGPYCLLAVFIAGQIGERLRKDTTKPLGVVALPEAAITPAVERAEQKAEAANANLTAAVETAKAAEDAKE
jgi:hypothetical protein